MTDSMSLMRELTQMNQKIDGMKQLITSNLDLQAKMLNCESGVNSPQLNSDFAVGHLDPRESNNVLLNLAIGRECFSIGAADAGMGYFHDANERVVVSRSKLGFIAKIMRTAINTSTAKVTEESGSGFFRSNKSKEAN